MYEQALADGIWNRACSGQKPALMAGDSALEAMLGFHSVTMNGGMLHSIECWSPEDLEAVKDGYRYFGIGAIAELISVAQAALRQGTDQEGFAEMLDREYATKIPDDATLVQAFEAHYKLSRESYTPLAED